MKSDMIWWNTLYLAVKILLWYVFEISDYLGVCPPVLQVLAVFRTKRCKNHILWGGTYLAGLYKGEYSPGENPCILKILPMGLGAL